MTSRTIYIGISFATVLVAYWAYALFALPWIEPSAPAATPIVISPGKHPKIIESLNDEFACLFPDEKSWERHDAKIISSNDQVFLLWKTYANHPDGWVELNPLTIIFLTGDDTVDRQESIRHAVVMEVPSGANLHFDKPLDLNRGGIGRLLEGRLRGQVKLRSQGKRPDHQDDMLVLTRDVELTEQRITTPNEVEFWYGPNSGRGRQMEIALLPRLGPQVANQEGPNVGGIEQFQLEHVERLHLDMGPPPGGKGDSPHLCEAPSGPSRQMGTVPFSAAATAAQAPPPADSPLMPGSLSSRSGPVDITCRGPFRFQLVEQVATFRDQVDVERLHTDGPSDRMNCDLLSVFFTRPAHPAKPAKGKPNAPGFDLQPARMEAQGSPATLNSPMEHLLARAKRLEYNLMDGQVFLEDSREVLLQKEHNEIHTPSLHYTPGPPGHTNMFQLLAAGPGWLRGEMADHPGQQLEARWTTKLEVRPQEQNEVISLTGGAALNFQAMGRLDAQEIHFWLHEAPPPLAGGGGKGDSPHLCEAPSGPSRQMGTVPFSAAGAAPLPGQSNFQPDRLLALNNVVGDSPQFSSKVERLEVWFSNEPIVTGTLGMPIAGGTPSAPLASSGPYMPSTALGLPQTAAPNPVAGVAPRQSHMEITGRLLQAHVTMHDQQHSELTEVTVVDTVRLQETQTALPSDLPLLVTGQWLHVSDANTPRAKVTVLGKPAHMEGRGMSLTGPNIAIDRGANLLTMEGAGQMDKLLDRDLENRPLEHAGTAHINWLKNMTFDGLKAHFQDEVKVTTETQTLQTGSMDVCFQQRISFSETRPQQPPLVETLHCGEGVYIVNRALELGQPVSYDRITLKDLDMNNITGDFHASGHGRVISVRRGGNQNIGMPGMPGGPLAGAGPAAIPPPGPTAGRAPVRPVGFGPQQGPPQGPPADPNQLTCLDLRFMKEITGNKLRKELTFHGQVRAAHSVVNSWMATLDDDNPNHLGPQAVVLHSENLEVADMSPVAGGGGGSMEFQALDNVTAEGTNFTARCARLSYSQAKDQLIFEGDGRSDAELYKQEAEGRPTSPVKAQKILYFLKTGQVNVDGFHSLEMNQVPGRPMTPGGR